MTNYINIDLSTLSSYELNDLIIKANALQQERIKANYTQQVKLNTSYVNKYYKRTVTSPWFKIKTTTYYKIVSPLAPSRNKITALAFSENPVIKYYPSSSSSLGEGHWDLKTIELDYIPIEQLSEYEEITDADFEIALDIHLQALKELEFKYEIPCS